MKRVWVCWRSPGTKRSASSSSLSADIGRVHGPRRGLNRLVYVRDLPSAIGMAVFEDGDIVRVRNFRRAGGSLSITDCWGVVTGYSDVGSKQQKWSFTRSAAPNAAAMDAGETVVVDSIVLDYGVSGNGFYEVNAIDGLYGVNSPYAQTVSWSTHPHSGQTVRTRMGNLYGIFTTANEYGLYAGTGSATTDKYLRISSQSVSLNNVRLDLRNSGSLTIQLQQDGDAKFGSDVDAIATTGLAIFSF